MRNQFEEELELIKNSIDLVLGILILASIIFVFILINIAHANRSPEQVPRSQEPTLQDSPDRRSSGEG